MEISTHLIEQELVKAGRGAEAQKLIAELPAKIDHEQHAQELQKLGLDPGKLVEQELQKKLA
ncbi:MAG TPA: hypothetical protein VGU02_09335 [Gaiellaceae bacterium]|nr:hypothetical protein [Gaiellaceae bacterium]